ncbi:MAG TPA: alpha/beta hydrolase [Steroidobacter sp.]|uniref:alpha/beta fold hydrolase n=1 Tax=Steroidobacter sp. TaxID=1978227 RepID=UPI002ED82410
MGAALSEDRFIDVDGATLRVRSAGEGSAVVLVHGWALDLDMWRAQIERLSHWYRVIAFDRRGFGQSTGEPGIERDVLDIDRVLERFDIEHAAMVGMSQGARVALRWALRHPQRTSCLVLDAPPAEGLPRPPGGEEIPIDDYRELLRREGIDAFRRLWLQHPYMQLHSDDVSARQLLREIVDRYPAKDLLMQQRPFSSPVEARDLRRLPVPTLVLSGEYDSPQRRSIAKLLAETIQNARLHTIAGAGHLAALDAPDLYTRTLHGFFSSQAARAAGIG